MINPQQAGQAYLTIGNYMLEAKAETPADTLCALMLLAGVIGEALNKCGYHDPCRELVAKALNRSYAEGKLASIADTQPDAFVAVDELLARVKA